MPLDKGIPGDYFVYYPLSRLALSVHRIIAWVKVGIYLSTGYWLVPPHVVLGHGDDVSRRPFG